MTERKSFSFLTFKIVVEIREDVPDGYDKNSAAGCQDDPGDDEVFRIWFSMKEELPSLTSVVHECWHLFMAVMNYVDKHEHTFEEMNNEIYAYNFHLLFSKVLDSILESKMYQRYSKKELEEN